MKKFAVLLLTALLALAAGAATAEKEKPAALPSAEGAWPELESVRALLDDDIQRIEIATYTEGGAGRFVFTDSAAIAEIHALCCALSLGEDEHRRGRRRADARVCHGGGRNGAAL